MNTIILRCLRYDAERWWYHRALRRQGQIAEARRLERDSVRSALHDFRGKYPVNHGGHSPYGSGWVEFHNLSSVGGVHPGAWTALHLFYGWACDGIMYPPSLYGQSPYHSYMAGSAPWNEAAS